MNLKLSEILETSLLLAILETWSQGIERHLRKINDTTAAATGEIEDGEEPRIGRYLVETAAGLEFLEVIGMQEHLVLSADGRGFPKERAHYVFAVVQLLQDGIIGDEQAGQPAQEGENKDGHETDQG